jgi:hypothetical protein
LPLPWSGGAGGGCCCADAGAAPARIAAIVSTNPSLVMGFPFCKGRRGNIASEMRFLRKSASPFGGRHARYSPEPGAFFCGTRAVPPGRPQHPHLDVRRLGRARRLIRDHCYVARSARSQQTAESTGPLAVASCRSHRKEPRRSGAAHLGHLERIPPDKALNTDRLRSGSPLTIRDYAAESCLNATFLGLDILVRCTWQNQVAKWRGK